MKFKNNTIYTIPEKQIHLTLYVDESKERKYKIDNIKKEEIDYIMILAVPSDKKQILFNKLNNARCLNEKEFGKCQNKCKYHDRDDGELHYNEIQKDNIKCKIASKWVDILLENDLNNEGLIYFNILGIIRSNLDMSLFGEKEQFGNMYTRFFRTALLRLIATFNSYDKIIIDDIYHDSTIEMEQHPYFDTNAIKSITTKQLMENYKDRKVIFNTDKIEFVDSDHRKSKNQESQFIQFVDIILGLTCNTIHNEAINKDKKNLTEKIYPLISRILSKNIYKKVNSSYHYFNKQIIGFFPNKSKEEMRKEINKVYLNKEIDVDKMLMNGNFFDNYKQILFKFDDGQISIDDIMKIN